MTKAAHPSWMHNAKLRRSMRDRLRAVQCPSDVTDQIGGWATDGVGQGYGSGYPMSVLQEWLKKCIFSRVTEFN